MEPAVLGQTNGCRATEGRGRLGEGGAGQIGGGRGKVH